MAASIYFPAPPRSNGFRDKGRTHSGLPIYSSAVQEKLRNGHASPWLVPLSLPIPGVRSRRLKLFIPNYHRIHYSSVSRFGRKRGFLVICFALFTTVFTMFALAKRFGTEDKQWPTLSSGDPPTLVFRREDLKRIWQWEVASGHYPSRRTIPEQLGLENPPRNPALPPRKQIPSRFRPPHGLSTTTTLGIGPKRVYLDIQSQPPNVAYPPRPVPGSVADLDVVMEHCDFSAKKYVRDCLEVLRLGAGLDNGNRLRRGKMDDWKYIYLEQPEDDASSPSSTPTETDQNILVDGITRGALREEELNAGFKKKRGAEWEPHLHLPPPLEHRPFLALPEPCDDESPRVFHMFWTGPFTDKPYLALLSFLFTQNTGLHLLEPPANVCRPQFWLWINPGPAASVPNPSATRDMFEQLKSNPWASPFLHPRFKDVVKFKLWNTTEQLDGVPELKDEWRSMDTLFNSGGHTYGVSPKHKSQMKSGNGTVAEVAGPTGGSKDSDDLLNRAGSKSSESYDQMSVILSDMARFILCHRFGGIYLDADTIFLRDWEELWGWKGAFAYRWSRLETYNTAVLHLNKQSALGSFLFRTALKNDLDFHPMTVWRYAKEAHLEGLLLRLPDALFDAAWLNTEDFQRNRPPQPYFQDFGDFFDTPQVSSAAPQALGFDGFFKGAYSYHFHNFWWEPFDPARNWPDLGLRFSAGEQKAREAAHAAALASLSASQQAKAKPFDHEDTVEDDQRDLDWATVLKRTFEAYIRGERPNMYGEWIQW